MNALVTPTGEILRTGIIGPEPASHDGLWVPEIHDAAPTVQWPQIAVQAEPVVEFSDGVPTAVRYGWTVRDRTTDERRREWASRDFDKRVASIAPGAWEALEAAAINDQIPAQVRGLLRTAIRQANKATTVISDDPDTLQFVSACVQLGILTAEQADQILNGP